MNIVSWTLAGPGTAPIVGAALRSVDDIVDACLVIDTTEGREPLRFAETDIVRHWPWRDDFAAARNAALDFVAETGADWAVMLDSDERIICPDPAAVRAYLAALPDSAQVVVAFSADGTYGRERFFRIPARSRWVGSTHEAFPVESGAQATIPANLIVWDELPKSAEQLRAKNERDRDLLLREIDDHPEDGRWWYYLGGALAGLGQTEDAINVFREAADRSADESGAMACVRAAVLLTEAKRYEEAVACCARGLTMRADIAELAWIAAGASYNLGALHQAEAWARLAKVHGEAGPGRDALERRVALRVPKALRDGPDEVLALVARAQGRARPALVPQSDPVRITVTSTGYKAAKWAPKCLASVMSQTVDGRHVYVSADVETLREARPWAPWIVDGRGRGLLENLLPIWRSLPDDEVIVWLDGDDWLAHDRALEIVAAAHQAGALATYGSYITDRGDLGCCAPVSGDVRTGPWRTSHLKTFRAGLVNRIRDEDLRRADGAYLDLAIDQAVMLPIVEMAAERAVYVPQVLCVYNTAHSFEVNASPEERAREAAEVARIRRMPRYERVDWP
jgi:tetratricopeptide (TPR) repeat protein